MSNDLIVNTLMHCHIRYSFIYMMVIPITFYFHSMHMKLHVPLLIYPVHIYMLIFMDMYTDVSACTYAQ